jgi:hypothetical protein
MNNIHHVELSSDDIKLLLETLSSESDRKEISDLMSHLETYIAGEA